MIERTPKTAGHEGRGNGTPSSSPNRGQLRRQWPAATRCHASRALDFVAPARSRLAPARARAPGAGGDALSIARIASIRALNSASLHEQVGPHRRQHVTDVLHRSSDPRACSGAIANAAPVSTPQKMSMMNEIAEPFGPPNGSTAPASACSASVVGWPSGSTAQPSGIACAGMGGDDDLAARDDAGRCVEDQGRFLAGGNADGNRIGAEEARLASERRHVRRRVGNRQADASRARPPSRRSTRPDRNDCCAGRRRTRSRASAPARAPLHRARAHDRTETVVAVDERRRGPRSVQPDVRPRLDDARLHAARIHRQPHHPVRVHAAQLRLDQASRRLRGRVPGGTSSRSSTRQPKSNSSSCRYRRDSTAQEDLLTISCSDRSAPATPSSFGPARSLAMISNSFLRRSTAAS